MIQKSALKLFDDKKVRTIWDDEQEKWYFSIVDVIEALTDSPRARKYWNALKTKLINEGSQLSQRMGQLTALCRWENVFNGCSRFRTTFPVNPIYLKDGIQFATLTDIIPETWAGKTTKEFKQYKGLKKENLRDNMTNTELILNMLAEASTKDISQAVQPKTYDENKVVAIKGGNVAKVAREELELNTGNKVVSPLNAKAIRQHKLKSLE